MSKLFKFLNPFLFITKKTEAQNILISNKNITQEIQEYLLILWETLNFKPKINNYCLIKYHTEKENSFLQKKALISNENDEVSKDISTNLLSSLVKIEWKIEITLSSIWMKKILRPMILLIFHLNDGKKKSVYMDINKFQNFRKDLAIILKNIHQIEFKAENLKNII